MRRVAAIDCGTNSIRLLVADVDRRDADVRLSDVRREMRVVRLGEGVDASGMLSEAALARTKDALVDYARVARSDGATATRMVATSATRDAGNRGEFFTMTRSVLGTPAEVITGDEEAALTFAGAVADGLPAEGPYLVADIGGGSTELVLGQGATTPVVGARSVDVGSVRLTERCLHSDPPTDAEIERAHRTAEDLVAPALERIGASGARSFVGVAGTVTTLSAVAQGLQSYQPERTHHSVMTMEDVLTTTDRVLRMSRSQRGEVAAIHPGRIDVIGGGAVVVRVLVEQLAARAGITRMLVSEHDILDGIALSIA